MTKEDLTYYHAALNFHFYGGELEPAIFTLVNFDDTDEDITARFVDCTDPFLIEFNSDFIRECNDDIFILTILLHEMAHEYCYLMDICDVDYDGNHTEEFVAAAEEHGLTFSGYKLTDAAHAEIERIIKKYNAVKDTCK